MAGSAAWYTSAYRRNVVDMHITADDERFLSEIDPAAYVDMLRTAQVQSTVLYAHSHTGLCYFPTQVGKMHPALKGRDLLGELIQRLHQAGIQVVVYCSLIFDVWAYRTHPDWQIRDAEGRPAAHDNRYGVCCPNSPYREHVRAFVQDLCTRYDFEGIRFDMTFWPQVCYCPSCQERFAREGGSSLPKVVDWDDPNWVAFQRARERWLAEFAGLATAEARRWKPGASVEHQSSTYPLSWRMGVTTALAEHNDFLQGDFYGDAVQGSFVRKLLASLSPHLPIGFETSISRELSNPTALKPETLLLAKSAAAMADSAAFIMIDSIDPLGTLDPRVYRRMGRVFEWMKPYQPYLGGHPVQDIAVYFSDTSKYDPADSGKAVNDPHLSGRMPHVEAVVEACRVLQREHVPFTVITRRNLGQLSQYKAVLLPNIFMMDADEAQAIREYVRAGGNLYASRSTGLQTADGSRLPDFLLADVFGVSDQGETAEKFTYIAPISSEDGLFGDYTRPAPVGFPVSQRRLSAHSGTEILGELVLPYTDPADPLHFASIHNNPPGRWTGAPAVVCARFGKGLCIYAAVDLERYEHSQAVFFALVRRLAGPFSFQIDVPGAVEVTAFYQPEQRRYIIHFVNFQKELPNIPVDSICARLAVASHPRTVRLLPGGEELAFDYNDSRVSFNLPRLETYHMVEVAL